LYLLQSSFSVSIEVAPHLYHHLDETVDELLGKSSSCTSFILALDETTNKLLSTSSNFTSLVCITNEIVDEAI
jgi:hypothetical protein